MADRAQRRVARLPDATARELRATLRLPTLSSIVYELAANALAAQATRITLSVDLAHWTAECVDNGAGFAQALVGPGGLMPHVVGPSHTGTQHALRPTARGDTLASLVHLGLVEVSTTLADGALRGRRWTLLQCGERVLYAGVPPAGDERLSDPRARTSRDGRPATGSRITVRDVYGNMRVRRAMVQRSPSLMRREYDRLRQCVKALALCHCDVSFSLRLGRQSPLSAPRTDALIRRFRDLYGDAHLQDRARRAPIPAAATLLLTETGAGVDPATWRVSLDGVIGTRLLPTAAHQHVSINAVPVPREAGTSFAYASFAYRSVHGMPWHLSGYRVFAGDRSLHNYAAKILWRVAAPAKDRVPRRPPKRRRGSSDASTPGGSRLMPHERHLHPAFVLNVRIEPADTGSRDMAPVRARDLYQVLSLLLDAALPGTAPKPAQRRPRHIRSRSDADLVSASGSGAADSCRRPRASSVPLPADEHPDDEIPGGARWAAASTAPATQPSGPLQASRFFSRKVTESSGERLAPGRVHGHASFKPTEPHLGSEALAFTAPVAQVDRKYIMCVTPQAGDAEQRPPLALLCMDQHAVDERIRLERNVASYVLACVHAASGGGGGVPVDTSAASSSWALPAPMSVPLQQREAAVLASEHGASWMQFWGFRYAITHKDTECTIASVPGVLAMRLAHEPDLVQDLVHHFVTWIDTQPQDVHQGLLLAVRAAPTSPSTFLSALRYLPPRFVGLLETQACHTAARFNQALSLDQCERLVRGLAGCVFPFQCAHGRCVTGVGVPS